MNIIISQRRSCLRYISHCFCLFNFSWRTLVFLFQNVQIRHSVLALISYLSLFTDNRFFLISLYLSLLWRHYLFKIICFLFEIFKFHVNSWSNGLMTNSLVMRVSFNLVWSHSRESILWVWFWGNVSLDCSCSFWCFENCKRFLWLLHQRYLWSGRRFRNWCLLCFNLFWPFKFWRNKCFLLASRSDIYWESMTLNFFFSLFIVSDIKRHIAFIAKKSNLFTFRVFNIFWKRELSSNI